jgi:DNA-binding NtrC family response regulator
MRDRRDDLPTLIDHFVHTHSRSHRKPLRQITAAARDLLMRYDFPGNMRELKNLLERGALLARGGLIQPEHLPDEVRHHSPGRDRVISKREHDFIAHACSAGAQPLSAELIRHTRHEHGRRPTDPERMPVEPLRGAR